MEIKMPVISPPVHQINEHLSELDSKKIKKFGISGNVLKILACVFMTADHIGVQLFPDIEIFRIIGRLAFPVFAFFISEGCRYTRNKLRYFITIAALGIVCALAYMVYGGVWYGNVLITFSLSIFIIYAMQRVKSSFFAKKKIFLSSACFLAAISVSALFCRFVGVDYGFAGVMVPVWVSLCDFRNSGAPDKIKKFDCRLSRIILFAAALVILSFRPGLPACQLWCLLCVPLIALYNGERGKYRLKYLFYIFYPAHLAVIGGISLLMEM